MGSRARVVVQERAQVVVGAEEDGRWQIAGFKASDLVPVSSVLAPLVHNGLSSVVMLHFISTGPHVALHFSIVPRTLSYLALIVANSTYHGFPRASGPHHDDLIHGAVLLEICTIVLTPVQPTIELVVSQEPLSRIGTRKRKL